MSEDAENIPALYTRHADAFAELRGKTLFEKPWLDRFTEGLPQGATILDLGCGSGEPLAAALIADGFRLTGIDVSPRLIELCRQRFPEHDWQVGDMRALPPLSRYAGILAWHSFFHLDFEAQRRMFPVFSILAAPGASLMFTSGPSMVLRWEPSKANPCTMPASHRKNTGRFWRKTASPSSAIRSKTRIVAVRPSGWPARHIDIRRRPS